jgi:hypothetical protein
MEATRSVRPERLTLPQAIRTREKRIRPAIRTVEEAIRLIDTELPQELQALKRWTLARALLVEAERTGKRRDLASAERQLKQALSYEGWLAD